MKETHQHTQDLVNHPALAETYPMRTHKSLARHVFTLVLGVAVAVTCAWPMWAFGMA